MKKRGIKEIYENLKQVFNPNQIKKIIEIFGNFNNSHEFIDNIYVSREEIRELDRISIEEYKIPSIVLMENAGRGAAEIILKHIEKGPVTIICGKGNNGGDGFVIARHLFNHNIPINIFYIGDLEKISQESDPGINLRILKNMGIIPIEIKNIDNLKKYKNKIENSEVLIDAILGTGLKGNLKEPILSIIKEIQRWETLNIAIDIPSGLCANTGNILGAVIPAFITITFGLPKKGFKLNKGPETIGKLYVVDISLPRDILEKKYYNKNK